MGGDLNSLPQSVGLRSNLLSAEIDAQPRPFSIDLRMRRRDVDNTLSDHLSLMSYQDFSKFRENLDEYEEFGDFGAKCVHPGTNLTGPNARLAANRSSSDSTELRWFYWVD